MKKFLPSTSVASDPLINLAFDVFLFLTVSLSLHLTCCTQFKAQNWQNQKLYECFVKLTKAGAASLRIKGPHKILFISNFHLCKNKTLIRFPAAVARVVVIGKGTTWKICCAFISLSRISYRTQQQHYHHHCSTMKWLYARFNFCSSNLMGILSLWTLGFALFAARNFFDYWLVHWLTLHVVCLCVTEMTMNWKVIKSDDGMFSKIKPSSRPPCGCLQKLFLFVKFLVAKKKVSCSISIINYQCMFKNTIVSAKRS